jgi:hypothetical protein
MSTEGDRRESKRRSPWQGVDSGRNGNPINLRAYGEDFPMSKKTFFFNDGGQGLSLVASQEPHLVRLAVLLRVTQEHQAAPHVKRDRELPASA